MDLENLLKNASLGNVELSNQLCAYLWDRKYTYAESENESIPTIDDSGELILTFAPVLLCSIGKKILIYY